jgi:3-oxoacyl-(acyl-carrier-protein) synthase
MARQRVVVTGLGGICALGGNAGDIWTGMKEGRTAAARYRSSPVTSRSVSVAVSPVIPKTTASTSASA